MKSLILVRGEWMREGLEGSMKRLTAKCYVAGLHAGIFTVQCEQTCRDSFRQISGLLRQAESESRRMANLNKSEFREMSTANIRR